MAKYQIEVFISPDRCSQVGLPPIIPSIENTLECLEWIRRVFAPAANAHIRELGETWFNQANGAHYLKELNELRRFMTRVDVLLKGGVYEEGWKVCTVTRQYSEYYGCMVAMYNTEGWREREHVQHGGLSQL